MHSKSSLHTYLINYLDAAQFPYSQNHMQSVELHATSLSEGPEKTFDDRYGNSSPRYMRENHYAILVQCLEFPTFSTYKKA